MKTDALTAELQAAAAPDLPAGLGQLTQVVVSREVCDWHRFKNRRQVSSYCQRPPALPCGLPSAGVSLRSAAASAPANTAAAANGCPAQ